MQREWTVHILALVYMCGVVALVLSAYRQEKVSVILRETAIRGGKFLGGIGVLSAIAFAVQRFWIDRG